MRIKIDGTIYHITDVKDYGILPIIETEEGEEFYLAENHEAAGEVARKYYEDLAQDDPTVFRSLVGDECLVNWALGISDGPGTTKVNSLNDWLDLWLDTPEEFFAGYDSEEQEVNTAGRMITEEIGFEPTVAYRNN